MYRVALIGCGRISKKHFEAIAGNEKLELCAVCDTNPSKRQLASETLEVSAYSDFRKMINSRKPDFVSVCTEAGNHALNIINIAHYGIPILVEKPLALTVRSADTAIEICNKHDTDLFVVKQNRYNEPVKYVHHKRHELGAVNMVSVRVKWCRRQEYFDMDKWRGTWEMDGGVFASQACHFLDLLLYFGGPVRSVFAKSQKSMLDIEVDDTAVALISFLNGAVGTIEASNVVRPYNLEAALTVHGCKGTAVIGGVACNRLELFAVEGEGTINNTDASENPPNIYGFGHKKLYEEVVHYLDGKDHNLTTAFEARRTVELFSALYESINIGEEVHLGHTRSRLGKAGICSL